MGAPRRLGRVPPGAHHHRAGELSLDELLAAARAGTLPALVLVRGDRALAEPIASRFAAALGREWGVEPLERRHPADLPGLVEDLRTFSLFGAGKLVVAIESGALADREGAAELLARAREALPWSGTGAELVGKARQSALLLLQVLHLFELDPAAGAPPRVLAQLPDALFGGARGRGAKGAAAERAAAGREAFEPLLAAAVEAGLRGIGESEVTMLADVLRDGLPERHQLVLVESSAPDAHPLVAALARRGAVVDAGRLTSKYGGPVDGLSALTAELERETGVAIRKDAAIELARRTLRGEDVRQGGEPGAITADSTERFAAEYRKLAALTGGGPIEIAHVEDQVEDRGGQDAFAILDAIGAGQASEALARVERFLAGADDRIVARLILLAQLATFVRRVVATGGILAVQGARRGVESFPRFRDDIAPALVGEVEGLDENPLARIKPFPLHRVYLAASRIAPAELARLPGLVLDTELELKGESDNPDAALADLVVGLARLCAPAPAREPARSGKVRRADR